MGLHAPSLSRRLRPRACAKEGSAGAETLRSCCNSRAASRRPRAGSLVAGGAVSPSTSDRPQPVAMRAIVPGPTRLPRTKHVRGRCRRASVRVMAEPCFAWTPCRTAPVARPEIEESVLTPAPATERHGGSLGPCSLPRVRRSSLPRPFGAAGMAGVWGAGPAAGIRFSLPPHPALPLPGERKRRGGAASSSLAGEDDATVRRQASTGSPPPRCKSRSSLRATRI
jgi:hypothetical protein